MPAGVREGFTEEVTFEEEEHMLRGQKETTASQQDLPISIAFYFTHLGHSGCDMFSPCCVHMGSVC